uniref:SWIM-type domain-containing protein n=1 Tax=Lactuca sativa TaxID=4236 RepID=A0A9R1VYW9_LACSA|nr:hypothetical protein LSAT_V11C300137640 [Lactuca sativa]
MILVERCWKWTKMNDCTFRLYAGQMYNEKSFQFKSLVGVRCCSRKFKFGSLVSLEWIGKHYIIGITNKFKMKLREMITDIKQRLRCVESLWKKWATDLIEGKLIEHYARVCDYFDELLTSNLGSTCKVSVTVNPYGKNYFHKFYIGFKDLSDGWKRGCRRVIGLDGCFLKGQVCTITWAVVDVEIKPNWTWFIELLRDGLNLHDGRGLVVISNQHKGLLEAVKDIRLNVEHRKCDMHIYANFKKSFTRLEFKKLFWDASMSCVELHGKHQEVEPIYIWVLAIRITKNMENKVVWEKYEVCILLNIFVSFFIILTDYTNLSRLGCVFHSQGHAFETRRGCDNYMVDLEGRSCSCKLWDLSGISCVHEIVAINYINQTTDVDIDRPVNGSNIWSQTGFIKQFPPLDKRIQGRPTINRKRYASEHEEYDHKQKGCKNEKKPVVPLPQKKKGRLRKYLLIAKHDEALTTSQSIQHSKKKRNKRHVQYDPKESSISKVLKSSRSKVLRDKKRLCIIREGHEEEFAANQKEDYFWELTKPSTYLVVYKCFSEIHAMHKVQLYASAFATCFRIMKKNWVKNWDVTKILVMVLKNEGVNDAIQTEEGGGIETKERVVDGIQIEDNGDGIETKENVLDGFRLSMVVLVLGLKECFASIGWFRTIQSIDEVEKGLDEILGEGSFKKNHKPMMLLEARYNNVGCSTSDYHLCILLSI